MVKPQRFALMVSVVELAMIETALTRALREPGEHAFVDAAGQHCPQAPMDQLLKRVHNLQDAIGPQQGNPDGSN